MRSTAVGEPPRWIWPRIVTRASYCGNSFFTRSASAVAPPVLGFSATITIAEFLLLRNPWLISSASWVDLGLHLRDDRRLGTRRDGAVERQVTRRVAHHLDEKEAFVA